MDMSLINKKPYYQKTFGAFRVKIYHSSRSIRDCYMTLDVPHTGEYHRIQANDRFYGLCFNCAAKHDDKALKSAIDVYLAVNALLFASQENVDAFIGVLNSISEGLFKKAEENAAKTTEEQEQADQALMSEAVREAARDIIEGYDEQGNNR
jgi:hypothetical protein